MKLASGLPRRVVADTEEVAVVDTAAAVDAAVVAGADMEEAVVVDMVAEEGVAVTEGAAVVVVAETAAAIATSSR